MALGTAVLGPQQCGKRQGICRIAVFVRRSAQHDLVPAEAGLPKQCIFRRNGLQICRHHVVIDFHHSGFCTDRLHGERYLDLAAGNFLLHLFFQFFFQRKLCFQRRWFPGYLQHS